MTFAPCLSLVVAVAAAQTIATYRVQHRPAAEMVSVAEAALGGDGSVTLDARTATLILNGPEEAIERTLALLEEMDRALRSVVVKHEIRERSDLDALAADVRWRRWQTSAGPFRIGTIPLPVDGIRVALSARKETRESRSRGMLRLLEGSAGSIVTGDALPFVYQPYFGSRRVTFVAAETGFEATASVVGDPGDERVQLDIQPFSGRFEEDGRLRHTGASTSITLSPGETVVIAEASRDESTRSGGLTGAGASGSREERVLLVSVEIEP